MQPHRWTTIARKWTCPRAQTRTDCGRRTIRVPRCPARCGARGDRPREHDLAVALPLPVQGRKASLSTASTDRVFDFLELVLIESKFYTIFSVLFGIGFSILITRAEAKGMDFRRFFLRRTLFLYLIGLAHGVLFWHNDILQSYAICGALLLPLIRTTDRTILVLRRRRFDRPLVFTFRECFLRERSWGRASSSSSDLGSLPRRESRSGAGKCSRHRPAERKLLVRPVRLRDDLRNDLQNLRMLPPRPLHRAERAPQASSDSHRNSGASQFWGHTIGLPLNVLYAWTFESESALHAVVATVAILPLSAGYVCLLAWLWTERHGPLLAKMFAPVGRMALTNYIGQSAICVLIFRGVGLGLGGTMGPTLYLPFGMAIYLVQLVASRAWLRWFQYGPLEWLWRMLTYGAAIRLQKVVNVRQ